MSHISQTNSGRGAYALRTLVVYAVITALVLIAIRPVANGIGHLSHRGHLHGFDGHLFAGLSLAIKIHIVAAVTALGLGGALMIIRKGRIFHRTAGWVWVSLVTVVAGSSLFIRGLNGGNLSVLHLITGWVLIISPIAVLAAKRHQVVRHRRAMMGLFFGGFFFNAFVAFIPGRTMWQLFLG